jgi:hypothetical protein
VSSKYVSKQEQLGHLWLAEVERFEYEPRDLDTIECADLADELWHHEIAAAEDPDFVTEWVEWTEYVYEHQIMLPLERSCHEGVLLPTGQRAVRLESCPESLLDKLRWFFEYCPRHVRSRIALDFYLLVRIDRARRTGNPDWRPQAALPAPEERVFFRPPVLKFRNYGR